MTRSRALVGLVAALLVVVVVLVIVRDSGPNYPECGPNLEGC